MLKSPPKDFCLWVVPPRDGKVKKLRFGLRTLLFVGLTGSLLAFGFLFIASDYARVQLLQMKSHFRLRQVTEQRDNLLDSKQALEGQVESLKTVNDRVLTYERSVKQRLDELASVIQSASSLGVISKESKPIAKGSGKEGIGGAEVICRDGRCNSIDLEEDDSTVLNELDSRTQLNPLELGSNDRVHSELDLIETMDRYIDLLKVIPFGVPANGHISSGYGFRDSPFHVGVSMHEGVDFSLSQGSHILSAADGVIKQVKRCPTYGLMVDVAHNDHVVTRYAHLSKTFVNEGEKVCRGEVIGLAGSSGRSTGPHLHYEVRINDKPHNPLRFIELGARLNRIFPGIS